MAVEGPNCLGYVNYVDGVPLTFGAVMTGAKDGRLGIVSQSGAMASVLRAVLHARDIGISMSISTGNEALSGVEDFFEYLIADKATRLIALMIEQLRNPRRFLDTGAARARRRQGDRSAASRQKRRRARIGRDPHRRHERRL